MAWVVIFHEAFDAEFLELSREVQTALAAKARLLESIGPMLGRPHVDTLKNSRHGNMKELRFDAADGAWRVALLSTRRGKPSFWSPATSPAGARRGSTAA